MVLNGDWGNYRTMMTGLALVSILIGIYVYPSMPENMASHWNAQGQPDGSLPKFRALFLMPMISAFLLLMFFLIPRLDPLKANIEMFRERYERFATLVMAFFFYIYLLTIFWNGGASGFDMRRFLSPALAVIFYYSGVLMENTKRNWFIGIRTPWTLSCGRVWSSTNKTGGRLFRIAGVVALFGALFPDYAPFLVIAPVVLSALYATAYSCFEYARLHHHYGKKALELVKHVPDGRVTTYKEVARALGNPKLARAVGNALNGNRDPAKVPCFKVVRSDGRVGGYVLGTEEKIRRLEKSGVRTRNGRIADFDGAFFRFQKTAADKMRQFFKGRRHER